MKANILRKGLIVGIILFLFIGMASIPALSESFPRDDTTPPVTTATLDPPEPNGDNGWYRCDVCVMLNATDNESGVNITYYRINNGSWMTYTSPFVLWGSNYYVIEFYSVDNVGNTEVPKQVEFKVDIEPPFVTISLDPPSPDGNNGWYIGNITVTVNATDDLSGVNATYYRYSSQSQWQVYTGPFILTDDFPSVQIKSIDNAGNFAYASIPTLKIDQTPPMIVSNGKILFNKITYTAIPSDNISGVDRVEFYFNGVLQATVNAPGPYQWTLQPIPHVNGSVFIIAYDVAGNWAGTYLYSLSQSNKQLNTQQYIQYIFQRSLVRQQMDQFIHILNHMTKNYLHINRLIFFRYK